MRLGGLDRRYLTLLVTRWVPPGLTMPVTVLLMQSRGLTLAQVGLGLAAQALLVILLEIPTGGLADSIGRRPLLVVAALLDVVAIALTLAAHTPAVWLAGRAVQGVYRALDSGPLEAWYVDNALAERPDWNVESGLARGGVAIGVAIAGASLACGLLASIPSVAGIAPLALPVAAALLFRVVDLGALLVLLRERRPVLADPSEPSASRRSGASVRAGVAATPAVIRATLRLLWGSPALLALVAVELTWGVGLSGLELLTPPRMAELLGDAERSVLVLAVAAALAWTATAIGAALTGRLRALLGGGPARLGALLRVVQGAALALAAVLAGPAGLLTGYLGFYLVHGSANAVHYGMVHQLVDDEHRATMISANSLASQLGAMVAGLGLGALESAVGIPAALAVGGVVMAAAAPLYPYAAARAATRSGTDPALTRGSSRG